MTFQGDTIIGKPSLSLIEIYVAEKGLFCEPQDAYDYWEKKDWLTMKGAEPKTLEAAIDSYNSIAVNRAVKKNAKLFGITKLSKKEKTKIKKSIRKQITEGNPQIVKVIKHGKGSKKPPKKKRASYDEQLTDKKWLTFRDFVLEVRGRHCEICGGKNVLQVHHPRYIRGRLAWEYTCNEVMVLCRDCHRKIHGIQ